MGGWMIVIVSLCLTFLHRLLILFIWKVEHYTGMLAKSSNAKTREHIFYEEKYEIMRQ